MLAGNNIASITNFRNRITMDQAVSFSPQSFSNSKRFTLSAIGYTLPYKSYYLARQHVNEYSFAYIISGKGIIEIAGEQIELQAGDTTILPAGLAFRAWSDPKEPQYKIWMSIQGEICDELYKAYHLTQYRYRYSRTGGMIQSLYEECTKSQASHDYLALRASLLTHELLASLSLNQQTDDDLQHRYAEQAKNYINLNLTKNLRMAEVADNIGISLPHLNRVFSNVYGYGPAEFYVRCRIDMAKALLLDTNIPITEISRQLGFNSERYFSSCFHKKTGVSPRAYRSAQRKS